MLLRLIRRFKWRERKGSSEGESIKFRDPCFFSRRNAVFFLSLSLSVSLLTVLSRGTRKPALTFVFLFLDAFFPPSFAQTSPVSCTRDVNMVCLGASCKARVERGQRRKRKERAWSRREARRQFRPPKKKKKNQCSQSQALSLEGIKRVAKELRDLSEKPEDGIWVSCSLREGRVGRGRFGIVKRRGEKSPQQSSVVGGRRAGISTNSHLFFFFFLQPLSSKKKNKISGHRQRGQHRRHPGHLRRAR